MNHFLLPDPTLPRSVQKARADIRTVAPHRILVASLDVGKDVDVPYFSTLTGQVLVAPLKIQTLKSGYDFFTQKLDQLLASGHFDLILMGHEPTGIYHEAWMYTLVERYSAHLASKATVQIRYRLIRPSLVKKERERLRSHHPKNDFIDTYAINNLLGQGIGSNLGKLDEATVRRETA